MRLVRVALSELLARISEVLGMHGDSCAVAWKVVI